MARSYGRFTTSIWLDPDFTSLTLEQQAVYFTLGLQPDVSAAGLLPYTSRRWARLSVGTSRDQIEHLVESLADHAGAHLVIDDDTEELLIRKFIKWDLGWCNEKRWPVVRDAVEAITSVHIRDIAVDELRRLAACGTDADTALDRASRRVQEWLSDRASRSDRVVVTKVGYVPNPQSATPAPESANPKGEPLGDAEPLSPFCPKHRPNGTTEKCGDCGTYRTAYTLAAQRKLEDEVNARRIAAEARAACDLCDDKGIRLDEKTRKPLGRCDHSPLATRTEATG